MPWLSHRWHPINQILVRAITDSCKVNVACFLLLASWRGPVSAPEQNSSAIQLFGGEAEFSAPAIFFREFHTIPQQTSKHSRRAQSRRLEILIFPFVFFTFGCEINCPWMWCEGIIPNPIFQTVYEAEYFPITLPGRYRHQNN